MKERQELEENEIMTKGNEVSNLILNNKKMVNIYYPSNFICKTRAFAKVRKYDYFIYLKVFNTYED